MLIVNERARAPYLRVIICNSLTNTSLSIKSDVYEAFVNYSEFIRIYLRKFHERGPLY